MRDFVWGGTGEGHNFHLVGFGDSEISSVQPRLTWEMVMALCEGKGHVVITKMVLLGVSFALTQ